MASARKMLTCMNGYFCLKPLPSASMASPAMDVYQVTVPSLRAPASRICWRSAPWYFAMSTGFVGAPEVCAAAPLEPTAALEPAGPLGAGAAEPPQPASSKAATIPLISFRIGASPFGLRGNVALRESVEPQGVVEQDLLLGAIRDIPALDELRDVAQEVLSVALVRIVRGEEDVVLPQQLDGVGQGLLVDLARVVEIAALHVLARLFRQVRRPALGAALVLLVEPVHHVRHPANARLQEGHAQVGEQLEHAVQDHAGQLQHLREGMLQGVRLDEFVDDIEAPTLARGAVAGQHAVEPLRLLVDGVEILVPVCFGQASRRRQAGAGHAQLGHSAAQLLHRRRHVVDG